MFFIHLYYLAGIILCHLMAVCQGAMRNINRIKPPELIAIVNCQLQS